VSSTRAMGIQSEQQAPNGSVGTADDIKHSDSRCQRLGDGGEGDSQDGQTSEYSIPCLPEDIWGHIHSLMPMEAAARAACLSHAFLSSWRRYPTLILCSQKFKAGSGSLRCKINNILKNHSGIGLKILWLDLLDESSCFPYIDGWLKVAVTPGIEELNLRLPEKHNFPCSVLSAGVGNSIRSLLLASCAFRPTAELGPFRSLTILRLCSVCITGDELECLLSNSLALKHLHLTECNEIISLKIPSVLQQLSLLLVDGCFPMQIIENKAPSISSFTLSRVLPKLELGKALQMMKYLQLNFGNSVRYARAVLPSTMPNLETIYLSSTYEVNTPMLPSKFVNLKHLSIQIASSTLPPSYAYSSLLSFLDASPSLETWCLQLPQADTGHELVGSSSHLRQLPVRRHNRLKIMEIEGFNCTKSLVELTCSIVKSAVSLACLKLYTLRYGKSPCCWDGFCIPYGKSEVEEASRAAAAIRRYIEDKVAPTTKLTIMEPCPRCIATAMDDGLA